MSDRRSVGRVVVLATVLLGTAVLATVVRNTGRNEPGLEPPF